MSSDQITSLRDFWPFYLGEHRDPINRWLHAFGSVGGLTWLSLAVAWQSPLLILAGLLNGYGLAWVGHFGFEKNKPASFKYPLYSFVCDWRLLYHTLTLTAAREVAKLDAPVPQDAVS